MSENLTATAQSERREKGSGCLIPPRPGVSRYWSVQVTDKHGKPVRRSAKVSGELRNDIRSALMKSGVELAKPETWSEHTKEIIKNPDNWTNITAAKLHLKNLLKQTEAGAISVGSDPSQLHYADLRKLYLSDYEEKNRKSLLRSSVTDEAYICGLKWLDKFFGYEKGGDKGVKVSAITVDRIDEFKRKRKEAGAASGTINRSLAALSKMFTIARQKGKLQLTPPIEKFEEPKQPRGGFLEIHDYEKLYNAFGVEVRNETTGRVSRPYAYIQPLLQIGYYTGMRLGEIKKLTWSNVDLEDMVIRLDPGTTKNDEGQEIPMIDGLPEIFEAFRRANPDAEGNERLFKFKTFIKAWRNICVKAAIKTKLNGKEIVSHFKDGKYCGFLFHDLRRSAVRNLIRAGVSDVVAMKITGHKTREVFDRYNIVSGKDLENAATPQ